MKNPVLEPADDTFEVLLRSLLPARVFAPLSDRYLEEPRKRYFGAPALLLTPGSVDEVAAIVKACNQHRVGIVPYGGGTGLVCGQVMPSGPKPVILSLERMKARREVLPQENVLIVEAGMVLANVQAEAEAVGRLFPLALASQGSCQIGGNLATNAGGVQVLRYGNARDLCLGLEAVLPDGSIWHGLSRLRKDNTGYDLRDLLIGAEGSLGLITAASLKMVPRPEETGAAFLAVPGPEAAISLLAAAQSELSGLVNAFELIHRQGLEFLQEKLPQVPLPMAVGPVWMVLLDLGAMRADNMPARLENFLAVAHTDGLITDALIAQNEGQRAAFWTVRETIPEANRLVGSVYSHDISLPVGLVPEFIQRGALIARHFPDLRLNCFGHLGDGNLHYNYFPPVGRDRREFEHLCDDIKSAVYDLVSELGGSVSAEHGIGRMKLNDLVKYGDPVKIKAMQAIKRALDPNGIMNPGATVPV